VALEQLEGVAGMSRLWLLPPPRRLFTLSCAFEQQKVLLALCSLFVVTSQVASKCS